MRNLPLTAVLLALTALGCDSDESAGEQITAAGKANYEGQSRAVAKRGGTFTVGKQTWTLVPSTQCSIYPGNVVSIAGHAEEDPSLEIIIDYGGPDGARIGPDSVSGWQAMPETLIIEIDGRHVHGEATFSEFFGGRGDKAEGSFDVDC